MSSSSIWYTFYIRGFSLRWEEEIYSGNSQLTTIARGWSHEVKGCDDLIGPVTRFDRYGKILERSLTRREMVFGVWKPEDGRGGFRPFVYWTYTNKNISVAQIDLKKARKYNAEEWIIDFVRQTILQAGWWILRETKND